MKITNITESGSNNLLLYAISHSADVHNDVQLQSLINDETCYLVTLSDVNFLEMFRLTQRYREKLKIVDEKKADIPPRTQLNELFKGEFVADEEKPDDKASLAELVEFSNQSFINLALQMSSDDDIIRPETARLFLPMLCRRFDLQIPISFMDLNMCFGDDDESAKLFNNFYPDNLQEVFIEPEVCMPRNMLLMNLLRATSIIRYEKHYDDLLKMSKYYSLKSVKTDKLYKFAISSFFKYDNVTRGETRCSMFSPNRQTMATTMKKMAHLSTPLKVDFVVQLPIQYMQMILNSYSAEELPVMYESSMSSIIEGGIQFNDFKMHGYDLESEDEEEQQKIKEYENAITAYKNRIDESNQIMLNTIPLLLQNQNDVDVTSVFALLPTIYTTKAVFTISSEQAIAEKLTSHFDDNINELMREMIEAVSNLQADIGKSR